VRFAARLKNAKCWPESMLGTTHRFAVGGGHIIEIRKCQAFNKKNKKQDRNCSGLAVTLLDHSGGVRGNLQMLLPGDCHFDGIPNRPNDPIHSLVAYHHGAATGWNPSTTFAISATSQAANLIYSYSKKNNYGHPQRGNYQPTWDSLAETTPNVRSKGDDYVDCLW
jgi:hypothetical protein